MVVSRIKQGGRGGRSSHPSTNNARRHRPLTSASLSGRRKHELASGEKWQCHMVIHDVTDVDSIADFSKHLHSPIILAAAAKPMPWT